MPALVFVCICAAIAASCTGLLIGPLSAMATWFALLVVICSRFDQIYRPVAIMLIAIGVLLGITFTQVHL